MREEYSEKAPLVLSILQAAHGLIYADSRRKIPFTVMAAAILLNAWSKQLRLLQSLVGALLYTGHASKVVSINNVFHATKACAWL